MPGVTVGVGAGVTRVSPRKAGGRGGASTSGAARNGDGPDPRPHIARNAPPRYDAHPAGYGWQEGYPGAHEFARTLVACIDVPENSVIEEVSIWGTKQIREMLNPF